MQLNHYNTNFNKRTFPIILVCDNITNAPNIGSLFRIADAFGIEKLIFCSENFPFGRKFKKTSRATENVVNFEIQNDILEVVGIYKNKGFQIISLEITTNSKPIHEIIFSNKSPILLIVGEENFGISDGTLALSDNVIHIDMYGQNSSMNVVQATNIALYEITKQLL